MVHPRRGLQLVLSVSLPEAIVDCGVFGPKRNMEANGAHTLLELAREQYDCKRYNNNALQQLVAYTLHGGVYKQIMLHAASLAVLPSCI